MIRELIVVEGKNDAEAVRRALGQVDIIWTEGYGLSEDKLQFIAEAAKRQGVIVLTDPDSVGNRIRERIRQRVPLAKHVYLAQEAACKNGDIGVENASPPEIQRAFAHIWGEGAQVQGDDRRPLKLSAEILVAAGLAGLPESQAKRKRVGKILGIGDCNAKQFLKRLHQFGISEAEFWQAVREVQG